MALIPLNLWHNIVWTSAIRSLQEPNAPWHQAFSDAGYSPSELGLAITYTECKWNLPPSINQESGARGCWQFLGGSWRSCVRDNYPDQYSFYGDAVLDMITPETICAMFQEVDGGILGRVSTAVRAGYTGMDALRHGIGSQFVGDWEGSLPMVRGLVLGKHPSEYLLPAMPSVSPLASLSIVLNAPMSVTDHSKVTFSVTITNTSDIPAFNTALLFAIANGNSWQVSSLPMAFLDLLPYAGWILSPPTMLIPAHSQLTLPIVLNTPDVQSPTQFTIGATAYADNAHSIGTIAYTEVKPLVVIPPESGGGNDVYTGPAKIVYTNQYVYANVTFDHVGPSEILNLSMLIWDQSCFGLHLPEELGWMCLRGELYPTPVIVGDDLTSRRYRYITRTLVPASCAGKLLGALVMLRRGLSPEGPLMAKLSAVGHIWYCVGPGDVGP